MSKTANINIRNCDSNLLNVQVVDHGKIVFSDLVQAHKFSNNPAPVLLDGDQFTIQLTWSIPPTGTSQNQTVVGRGNDFVQIQNNRAAALPVQPVPPPCDEAKGAKQ